jgi:hypothetical protein
MVWRGDLEVDYTASLNLHRQRRVSGFLGRNVRD